MSRRKGSTGLTVAIAAGAFLALHGGHRHGGIPILDTFGPVPVHGGSRAVAYARAQLGKPYLWGGTGPEAFDCSGLTQQAWRDAGVSIPRTAAGQWAAEPHISRSQLRPGDLAFAAGADGSAAAPGHVVIYIGNGRVIQAYAAGYPVMVSSLASVHATGYADPGAK